MLAWFTTSLTTFGPLWPLMIKYNWPDHANTSSTKNNKTPNKRKALVSSCRKHPPNLPNVVSPTKPPTIILRIANPRLNTPEHTHTYIYQSMCTHTHACILCIYIYMHVYYVYIYIYVCVLKYIL